MDTRHSKTIPTPPQLTFDDVSLNACCFDCSREANGCYSIFPANIWDISEIFVETSSRFPDGKILSEISTFHVMPERISEHRLVESVKGRASKEDMGGVGRLTGRCIS